MTKEADERLQKMMKGGRKMVPIITAKNMERTVHGKSLFISMIEECLEKLMKRATEEVSQKILVFVSEEKSGSSIFPKISLHLNFSPLSIEEIGTKIEEDIKDDGLNHFVRFDNNQKADQVCENLVMHMEDMHQTEDNYANELKWFVEEYLRNAVLKQLKAFRPTGKAMKKKCRGKEAFAVGLTSLLREIRRTRWRRRCSSRDAPYQLNRELCLLPSG